MHEPDDAAIDELQRGFYRYATDRASKVAAAGGRLAHYTTAENALRIIGGKALWLRNAGLMNDFMEMSYGSMCLETSLSQTASKIDDALAGSHPGLAHEILARLQGARFTVEQHTFLTSLAEHPDGDRLGKLSMWRAYGGPAAGIALIFNTEVFENEAEALQVFAHPVLYGGAQFVEGYASIVDTLTDNPELVAAASRARLSQTLFHAFQDLVLTTKHEGFAEEQEWRVIHSPGLLPSEHMSPLATCIHGIPQIVYPITLEDRSDIGMPELALDRLLHQVLIGPSRHPEQVGSAVFIALERAGISNPRERIVISDIPLRQRE